jgi:type I restriction enzyme M protein
MAGQAPILIMSDSSSAIVSKVWNYAHVLKNAGVGYGDYVEQITYLLFLKLADEMTELGFYPASSKDYAGTSNPIPAEFRWPQLVKKSGDDLEVHYRHTLENLGKVPGLVGIIFRKAQNKISNPSDLQRVIKMIGDEDWSGMDVDIKGAIYEGLLEKTASSSDKGAGQYFTPRPLIRAILDVMQPKPGQVIGDPACGTGGFLLAAVDYISQHNKLSKAVSNEWRIPESSLHLGELLGGWPGAFLAQRRLRHKCSKPGYQAVFWTIVLLHQIASVDVMLDQRLSRAVIGFLNR